MQGLDGRIVHDDANDVWLLDLTADVNMPGVQIPVGTELPLLPCATLESILDDANSRTLPVYRLSVQVTRYEGRNFLFPIYYLPLSQWKEANEPQQEPAGKPAAAAVEPNGALSIPADIAQMLNNRRPLSAPRRPAAAGSLQPAAPRMVTDLVGFIERRQGREVFIPDALGLNVSAVEYELLPCATLEEAQRMQAASPDRIRFGVAGLLSEFKGRKYLLLQRATRVHSFGDFGG